MSQANEESEIPTVCPFTKLEAPAYRCDCTICAFHQREIERARFVDFDMTKACMESEEGP
jgi:hypothetical protein